MNLEQEIREAIAEVAAVRPADIHAEDRLREDLGLDSVSSMELLSVLAERYDVDIEMEEAVAITTVAQIIEVTRTRLGAPS
ncbi:MAG: acyl carrier protein [Myxococcales bacterium]|nr:acyl carrier protein [Myxococcales bacterium]MCB9647622.1 acyl carrier protein [Deltaproteobacteria bacterium]